MPRFKDQAICIRHIDWSETSQVVSLLTAEHGKIRGVAKGSKRSSPGAVARFSGGIELLTEGEVVGMVKPTTDLANITEWDLQHPNWHFRERLSAQRAGLYVADITNALLADHDTHPDTFLALQQCLRDLANPANEPAALLRFQWRLLTDAGYSPELQRDVRLASDMPDSRTYLFDPQAGGFTADLNDAGGSPERGPWRVRSETLILLRNLASSPEDARLPDEAEPLTRANRLLCVYIRAILDRQLPTMAYLLNG